MGRSICGARIVRNACSVHRRGDDEVRTGRIRKRPVEDIDDLTTREEFFNEY